MCLFHLVLSQEIADGVSKSTQAVQAAEAGIRQIGAVARQQTICMLELQLFFWIQIDEFVWVPNNSGYS